MTAAISCDVKIIFNANEHIYRCAPGQSVLGAMMAGQGQQISVGCRRGGCGACRIFVRAGAYVHQPMSVAVLTAADQQAGYALACRIYPETPMIVEPAPLGQGRQG